MYKIYELFFCVPCQKSILTKDKVQTIFYLVSLTFQMTPVNYMENLSPPYYPESKAHERNPQNLPTNNCEPAENYAKKPELAHKIYQRLLNDASAKFIEPNFILIAAYTGCNLQYQQ